MSFDRIARSLWIGPGNQQESLSAGSHDATAVEILTKLRAQEMQREENPEKAPAEEGGEAAKWGYDEAYPIAKRELLEEYGGKQGKASEKLQELGWGRVREQSGTSAKHLVIVSSVEMLRDLEGPMLDLLERGPVFIASYDGEFMLDGVAADESFMDAVERARAAGKAFADLRGMRAWKKHRGHDVRFFRRRYGV